MTRPADVVSAVAPALDALSVLRKARALIEKPEHWTQGTFARDANGMVVKAYGAAACRFCAAGAVYRVLGDVDDLFAHPVMRLLEAASPDSIPYVNDELGHAAVLAAFDKAIASLEDAAIGSKASRGAPAGATAETPPKDQS